jgi:hypothetical protein
MLHISDGFNKMFFNLKKFNPDYQINEIDYLNCRTKSIGENSRFLKLKNMYIIDVGGQRNERNVKKF